jgi:glycosyltransferase involved in cell wall biosynthesis
MSGHPLVSVVIPTWNRLQLVQEAIASVVAQTYENWELIVVDDGSTDGTVEELRKLIDDPRIAVIASPHIGNLGQLRDLGARAAKGEWFAFLDSDDLWQPNKLELQLQALARTGDDWSYTVYEMIDDDKLPIPLRVGQVVAISGWIADDLLTEATGVCAGTLLVRRRLFDSVGGFSKNGIYPFDDVDLAFRLALAGQVVALPEPLTRVREHGGRMSVSLELGHHYMALVYEEVAREVSGSRTMRLARRRLAHHLAEAGAQRMTRGEFSAGLRCFIRAAALRDRPGHWLRAAARGARAMFRP